MERIDIDLPVNDIRREESGYHYVSFFMIPATKQFILFDALQNGVVTGCMTEKQVYQFDYPDRPKLKVNGSAFTFFLFG